jgi:hypothetical protein
MGNAICHLVLKMNVQKNVFAVQVYINSDKDLWEHFKDNSIEINRIVGQEVIWWESSKASGGTIRLQVLDVFDQSNEVEYFEWLYQTLTTLKKALVPHVQTYKMISH